MHAANVAKRVIERFGVTNARTGRREARLEYYVKKSGAKKGAVLK